MLENKEIWKDCKGYEGKYQVSNFGRVWSVCKQQYKSQREDKDGYYRVTLIAKNGKSKVEMVHRLVALAFLNKPDGYNVVNHLDSNIHNNRADNLEWTNVQGNTKHGYDHGRVKEAQEKATEAARLINMKTYLVYKNNEFIGEYIGRAAAANATGVDEETVRLCAKEHRKTREGYSFEIIKGGGVA